MTEEERADWLARAVDDIVHGASPQGPSRELDAGDIESLLRIARLRRDGGNAGRQASANHEGDVWQSLIDRIEGAAHSGASLSTHEIGEAAEDDDSRQMSELIAMRHNLSAEALGMAEEHREEVWQRVRQRIAKAEGKRKPSRGDPQPNPHVSPHAADPVAPPFSSGDPELDSLVRAALAHAPVARDPEMQARLWARVGVDQGLRLQEAFAAAPPNQFMPRISHRMVGAIALAGLFLALLAPLPSTGLGGHPAVAAAEYVAERVGVVERSDPPPPMTRPGEPVAGVDATLSEGAILLGLPVAAPAVLPRGFKLISSRYFPTPITAVTGGVFTLVYANDDASAILAIHQESASGADLAADQGSSRTTFVGASPATYIDGGWQAEGNPLSWQSSASQTIVFDTNGVRTIVQYTGPALSPDEFLAVAGSIADQR